MVTLSMQPSIPHALRFVALAALVACASDDPVDVTDASVPDAAATDVPAADAPPFDAAPPEGAMPAFPGAEGFGTHTTGGRGGRVFVVTTLDWDGPGSFSEALYTPEPRIITFAVSGVVAVPDGVDSLQEEHSFVTIAGQTSPGGITFRGGGTVLEAYRSGWHDVVVRHVRFRGNGTYDNISLNTVNNIVFDHCDFSGAEDEALDIVAGTNITISWSTITNSGPDGQRYGALLAYAPTANISFHHNYMAHHAGRCAPHMHWASGGPPAEGARVDLIGNVFYNCASERLMHISVEDEGGDILLNLIANRGLAGPNTPIGDTTFFTNLGSRVQLFASENRYEPDLPFFPSVYHEPVEVDAPHPGAVSVEDADRNTERVLEEAGAWPRDPMGLRTVADARNGTGSLGDISDALIEAGPDAPTDSDSDGMPDTWEVDRSLNPSDGADAADDRDEDGYTNIEEYINELAYLRVAG